MRGMVLGVGIIFTLLVSDTATANERSEVHLRVVGASKFDVIYHRALTNGTGAALAGLIGAGIQAGIESNKDNAKRNELEPLVATDLWQRSFVDVFTTALAEKQIEVVVDNAKTKSTGLPTINLVLYPKWHGFKSVNSTTQMVSSFVEFEFNYAQGTSSISKSAKREVFFITGQKQVPYETWRGEPASINPDLESVFSQAARRLANKIIYNVH